MPSNHERLDDGTGVCAHVIDVLRYYGSRKRQQASISPCFVFLRSMEIGDGRRRRLVGTVLNTPLLVAEIEDRRTDGPD